MTKLNKQGVRDLSYLDKRRSGMSQKQIVGEARQRLEESRADFGKNQMPGELAAKLLSEQPAEFGAALDPQVEEFLHVLAEECAETIQRVTKILRFGLRNNPWTGKNNLDTLHAEFGDILAAFEVLNILGVTKFEPVRDFTKRKLDAFVHEENPARPRIRHMTPELRARIADRAKKFA